MTKYILITIIIIFIVSCKPKQTKPEWVDLFNGKDLKDWTVKIYHHDVGVNFGNTFRVVDNMIQVRYDEYEEFNDQFAHLYYNKPFSRYHLKLEYQFTGELQRGAPDYTLLNSGVMFHSQDPHTMPKEQNWPISVEMQFLAGLDDGNPRPTGNMCSPGTDIVYEGKKYDGHCLNSSSKTYNKDAWVQAELIVLGDSLITQIISGDTVLQYTNPTMGGGVVSGYDSALWKPGMPLTSGFIALQSEGQPINFRNIRIKELK
ncbi:MAG TPA: DUF1080 domain-containing protein [Cyclobacteriaceae bacterium]|nr:DUF1080 domain-containing protein [Cytophagales bacterium]HNT50955.1 DUF1080 domain-containing protein [Cyclobacteriaceae bacterium]HRE66950.1 DUF1080 domain-containing protein [Cyclobacteriaceae bacterium]HRF33124.1 DUF1080 domain-containing protein [Cyclobacteriaceae bacterium]